jgi:uncharacterized protein
VFNLLPKDDKFFDQLDALSRILVDGAQNLSGALQVFPNFQQQHATIEELRRKSQDLAQASLKVLDHAFITPLDREDILLLITGMNDVMDEISELSERLGLYPLDKPYPNLEAQARHLSELAIQVQQILGAIRAKTTLTDLADTSMKRLLVIEESVRGDRRKFLSELFKDTTDPIDLIKKKDLHDLLERALAHLIEVTQVLARVVLKNA